MITHAIATKAADIAALEQRARETQVSASDEESRELFSALASARYTVGRLIAEREAYNEQNRIDWKGCVRLNSYPPMVMARHPIDDGFIMIQRGHEGYAQAGQLTIEQVRNFNDQYNATEEDLQAMLTGSMFGWQVPGADPTHERNINVSADNRRDFINLAA